MQTLRQEIEKLISDLTKVHIERRDHPNDYVRGRGDGIEMAVDNLTDILSRHHEEPAAPFNPQDELKAIQEWIKDNPEQHEKILDEINAQPNIGPTARQMFAMMRCDHPEPPAPSQRERIATEFRIGDIVYHRSVYEHKEPLKVVGITEDKLLLEGDYSGGTHNVVQRDWLPIKGTSRIQNHAFKEKVRKDAIDIETNTPVQDWPFILSNAIKHLKEEEIAGLCFDLYCRSSLQEVIDVKINTHKAQQPNGTIADAQAVHEYGNQPTAPSQRERIATALFLEIMSKSKISACELAASQSVTATDALIAELSKTTA